MKKLILSVVFVFAFVAVTPISASNELSNSNPVNCVKLAFDTQTKLEKKGWTLAAANTAADAAYDSCRGQKQKPKK